MALQIRRGTNAERQLIVPLQGEMIFTTDTKKLYVGDGTTPGGIAVDTTGAGGSVSLLNDLDDVTVSAVSTGQVLKWNGSAWVNSTDNTGGGGTTINSINDIPDVSITTPTTGQVLKFNGTSWINGTDISGGAGSVALDDVTDVNITSPVDGQVLKYQSGIWINGTDISGGAGSVALDDVTDVFINTPTAGQVLKFNGTSWVNDVDSANLALSDVTDVSITAPTAGQVLKFDGISWVNDVDLNNLALSEVTDVFITTPTAGQVLKFNGTSWVNDLTTLALSEVTDVSITTPTAGQVLKFDGISWLNSTSANLIITDTLDNTVLDPNLSVLNINTIETSDIVPQNPIGLTIGSSTAPTNLYVNLEDTLSINNLQNTWIELNTSSGTLAAPLPMAANSTVSGFILNAWNGTDYRNIGTIAGRISPSWNGTDPNIPGDIVLLARSSLGATVFFTCNSFGVFNANSLRSFGYADTAARNTALTSPALGTISYIQNQSRLSMYVADTGLATGGASNATPGWVFINGSLT